MCCYVGLYNGITGTGRLSSVKDERSVRFDLASAGLALNRKHPCQNLCLHFTVVGVVLVHP